MLKNKDLLALMVGYRKAAAAEYTKLIYKKIGASFTVFLSLLLVKEFDFYLPLTIFLCFWLVMFFRGFFDSPEFEMDEGFYIQLARLSIQDKKGLEKLKGLFKEKSYLSLSDVEDFVESEVAARALAGELENNEIIG